MKHTTHLVAGVALCALNILPIASPPSSAAEGLTESQSRILKLYPGLRIHRENDRDTILYGRNMTSGISPDRAADAWLARHNDVLGDADLDLRRISHLQVSRNRHVLAYQQYLDGLPVEYGIGRIVTSGRNFTDVVLVSANIVRRPLRGFSEQTVDATAAVDFVRNLPSYQHLEKWSKPHMVIYAGEDQATRTVLRAWKFTGEQPNLLHYDAYTFFVDVATGKLVHARREVYSQDLHGHIAGMGSPGVFPDTQTNPPVALDLADLELIGPNGSAITTADGAFVLPHPDDDSLEVTAELSGPWVSVHNLQGENLTLDETVSPAQPANFVFNSVPTEFGTAQVNAFVHVNLAHDFFHQRQPDFTAIDMQLPARVNLNSTCNAFFSPIDISLTFYNAGPCVNTAYSSVIHHEYGHFVVNRLHLRQEAFGEGYGDVLSIMINNDPIVGRDFLGPGIHVRNVEQADRQFPCRGEAHDCGQVLGGVWWDIKKALAESLGEPSGLEVARQLFADWSLVTLGIPFGPESANQRMAAEVLAVDDDDADINNGTPHQAEICAGFAQHSIPCPGVCEELGRLRLFCPSGSNTLRAFLTSDYPEGTKVGFTLVSSEVTQTATVSRIGVARTTFENVPVGFHKVCIENCPGFCRTIGCPP